MLANKRQGLKAASSLAEGDTGASNLLNELQLKLQLRPAVARNGVPSGGQASHSPGGGEGSNTGAVGSSNMQSELMARLGKLRGQLKKVPNTKFADQSVTSDSTLSALLADRMRARQARACAVMGATASVDQASGNSSSSGGSGGSGNNGDEDDSTFDSAD
jgi:hypothetical protein